MNYTTFPSPLGSLVLWGGDDGLAALWLPSSKHTARLPNGAREDRAAFRSTLSQLEEYFAGERSTFDVPLSPHGTAFQRKVWTELRRIPFGHTMSYGELAARIEQPKASRAVGLANGRNPISIIVPCHRVIGHDGALTGYGGGLDAKRWLLDHEAHGKRQGADSGNRR
jgi:methylated-DNA-[protein]-cysteine S-methyltransferase